MSMSNNLPALSMKILSKILQEKRIAIYAKPTLLLEPVETM